MKLRINATIKKQAIKLTKDASKAIVDYLNTIYGKSWIDKQLGVETYSKAGDIPKWSLFDSSQEPSYYFAFDVEDTDQYLPRIRAWVKKNYNLPDGEIEELQWSFQGQGTVASNLHRGDIRGYATLVFTSTNAKVTPLGSKQSFGGSIKVSEFKYEDPKLTDLLSFQPSKMSSVLISFLQRYIKAYKTGKLKDPKCEIYLSNLWASANFNKGRYEARAWLRSQGLLTLAKHISMLVQNMDEYAKEASDFYTTNANAIGEELKKVAELLNATTKVRI